MSSAQPGSSSEVVLWRSAESAAAAAFAAELSRHGIVVRDHRTATAGELYFVDAAGWLLVDPSPGDVARLLRSPGRGNDAVEATDSRSATVVLVDVAGTEHRVVVVDRPAGCVCACLVDGALVVVAGGGQASALRALALQLSSRTRSCGPDGLDRLRLMMLAGTGDVGLESG